MAENIPVLERQFRGDIQLPQAQGLDFAAREQQAFTTAAIRAVSVLSQAEREQKAIAEQNARQERTITHYRLKTEIAKRFSELDVQFADNPSGLATEADKLRLDITRNIPDPELNALVGYEIDARTLASVGQATHNQTVKKDYDTEVAAREYIVGATQRIQSRAANLFTLSPQQRATASAELAQDLYGIGQAYSVTGVEGKPLFTPAQTVAGTQSALSMLYNSSVVGWLNTQPNKQKAYDQLTSGKLTLDLPDGKGGVSKINVLEVADPETIQFARSQAAAAASEQRAQQSAALKEWESSFELQLAQAENNPKDLAALKERLDANRGALTEPGKYNYLLTKIVKANNKIKDNYDTSAIGAEIIRQGVAVNPADTESLKAVNTYYEQVMAPQMRNMPMETRMAVNAELVAKTRIIPRLMEGAIKSAATSLNTQDVIEAARLIDSIGAKNPYLVETLDKQAVSRIGLVDTLIKNGHKPEDAVNKADEMLDPGNQPVIDSREQALRKQNIDYEEKAKKVFKSRWPFSGAKFGGENTQAAQMDEKITATMGAHYRKAYETSFKLTGNSELAEKEAERSLNGRFGRTEINNRRQVTIHPPDIFYTIGDDDTSDTAKWLRAQINEDAAPYIEKFKADNGLTDFDPNKDIMVIADPIFTPKTASQGRPEYKLQAFDKTGVLVDVLPNNRRWYPDQAKEINNRLGKLQEKRNEVRLPEAKTVNPRLDYAPF